ncbi:unnamed protein product [Vitrella brassicaformis CCMP3155]|uniref:SF-assemblin n=1 Tax=Vitrella brassicaformis (strain CCMP3155) TaxID=1169540 RepID=A0A0G4FC55_VITBC|nr:unnamed protein product [Vitrella brassicaformis CCMP3155]|eukprot:CEM10756.1 unnamed protein product [Vitrella brassicaformis CCMP3155]
MASEEPSEAPGELQPAQAPPSEPPAGAFLTQSQPVEATAPPTEYGEAELHPAKRAEDNGRIHRQPEPANGTPKAAHESVGGDKAGATSGGVDEARDDVEPTARLRLKLCNAGERLTNFDKEMGEETRRRKVKEETRLQGLREDLERLERTLHSEVRRRVEVNKILKSDTEQMTDKLLRDLQDYIGEKMQLTKSAVENLENRCTVLASELKAMQVDIPQRVKKDAAALQAAVVRLRQHMDAESTHRHDRSQVIDKKVEEVETSFKKQLDGAMAVVNEHLKLLRKELEGLMRSDDTETEQFRGFVLEEISKIKQSLVLEAQAREQSDDEIVGAIHNYTNALQRGLRSANLRYTDRVVDST